MRYGQELSLVKQIQEVSKNVVTGSEEKQNANVSVMRVDQRRRELEVLPKGKLSVEQNKFAM